MDSSTVGWRDHAVAKAPGRKCLGRANWSVGSLVAAVTAGAQRLMNHRRCARRPDWLGFRRLACWARRLESADGRRPGSVRAVGAQDPSGVEGLTEMGAGIAPRPFFAHDQTQRQRLW